MLLALVSVLAAGLTGFYAYDVSRSLLVQSAKNELLTSNQALARRITLTREEIARNLQMLAAHPATLSVLQKADPAQEEQLATLFRLVMGANQGYFQVRLIAASDGGIERVRVDRDGNQLLRVSGDNLQEKGHFPYVFDTLKLPAGVTYMSRIAINHERGAHAGLEQPTVLLATPVTDLQGVALGIVVVNVDLNGMFALLAADLPKELQLFLANRDGDFLIHPDSTQTFGFDKGRRVLIQDEFPATRDLVEGKADKVLIEASDGRYANIPMVAAFIGQHSKVITDESRVILGLAQPLAAVLEQADKLGAAILQIVLGFCLACILLAALVARAVTRPINAMSAAVQRFSSEYQIASLPLERQDEIGVLARNFYLMQDQIKQQLAELHDSHQELDHLARHDMLTGLPNRRLFLDRLEHALARARRSGERVALLFIDLDNFKEINDRLGHDAGDAVLKEVAARLSATTREVDTVARLGGDEFVVLLDDPVHCQHIAEIAQKLLNGLRPPILLREHALQVGASIGISQYPEDGSTATEIIANADRAMYEAKTTGRNRFRFASVAGTGEP